MQMHCLLEAAQTASLFMHTWFMTQKACWLLAQMKIFWLSRNLESKSLDDVSSCAAFFLFLRRPVACVQIAPSHDPIFVIGLDTSKQQQSNKTLYANDIGNKSRRTGRAGDAVTQPRGRCRNGRQTERSLGAYRLCYVCVWFLITICHSQPHCSLSHSLARTEIFIGLVKMRIVCGAAAFNAGRGRWVHSSFWHRSHHTHQLGWFCSKSSKLLLLICDQQSCTVEYRETRTSALINFGILCIFVLC